MSRTEGAETLLERETELAELEAGIAAAADGRGSVIVIEGPAGIGKSALIRAACASALDRGFEVLRARGGELERSFGFGIARQLFATTLAEASDPEREELLEGAASLATPALLVGEAESSHSAGLPAGDPAASINHGLHWLVANLASRAPVLIAIDDLHWSDKESLRWLVYLARRRRDLAVLVTVAIRSGEPGLDRSLVAALKSEAAGKVLKPHELTDGAATELIRAEMGAEADERFSAACHRASGGNPFLLRELIRALIGDEVPPVADSMPRIEELHPESVSRSILLRLGSLPEGVDPLARALAVLGEAESRHAAALAELDADTAARAADAMREAGILAPGPSLRFSHPLIRAAVYGDLPDSQRALAHQRAADVLIDGGARPEQVAAQLLEAEPGHNEHAVGSLRRAAADATSRMAAGAAVAYLRRALLEPLPPAKRRELMLELIAAAVRAADLSAFEGISDDPAGELSADPETLKGAGPFLIAWLFFAGELEQVTEVLERTISAYRRAGQEGAALGTEALTLSLIDVKPEDAVKRLEGYKDRLTPGSPEQHAWFAMRGWWQHLLGGAAQESVALVRKGLDEGRSLEGAEVGPVYAQAILVLLRADELDEAQTMIELLMADAQREGGPAYYASAFGLRSCLAFRRGALDDARVDAERAVELTSEHGIGLALAVSLRYLLDVLIETGELEEAENALGSNRLDGQLPDHWWFAPLRFGRARLRIAQGRVEEGIEELRETLRRRRFTRAASDPIASSLALALHSLHQQPTEVECLLRWELDEAREWGTPRGIAVATRGMALAADGDRQVELLDEAARMSANSPAMLEHARALADLGAALRRANRRKEAREHLRKAIDIAHRCGARPLEDRAGTELAATGARPRRQLLTGVESLTPSELRVARMAAAGMENRRIAQELFVSVKTIETHLRHVFQKLDVSSRKELPEALGRAAP